MIVLPLVTQAERPSKPIEIWLVSSLLGYVEPCGCTVDVMLGGIDRLVGVTKKTELSDSNDLKIVSGPTFYDPEAPRDRRTQDRLKSELIGSALKTSGFGYSVPSLTEANLTKMIEDAESKANLISIREPKLIEHNGYKIGVFPIGSKAELQSAYSSIPRTLKGSDFVIAFSFLTRRDTRRLVRDTAWIDLAVVHREVRERNRLNAVGTGYLLEAGDRGRHVAKLTIENPQFGRPLVYDAPKATLPRNPLFTAPLAMSVEPMPSVRQKRARLKYELIPLNDDSQREPIMSAALRAYTQSLQVLYAEQTRTDSPLEQPTTPYAGVDICGDCHPDAVTFWQGTEHAHAWATLQKLDKTFDAECVSCHVTGWQKAGGTRIGYTTQLQNVQCEVCHGPGKAHAESGGDSSLLSNLYQKVHCSTCHNAHHSPRFSYPEYIKAVLGVGHGVSAGTPER